MKKNSLIYVAGDTGLVGSALIRILNRYGYKNILTAKHNELDITDIKQTEDFFKKYKPEYVFFAAAKVGGIYANDTRPADFIYPNLMIQSNVIHMSYKYRVKKLLFLGCACLYPKICKQPIKEEYLLSGTVEPTNEPYSVAKISGIKMCQAYNKQYGTNFIVAMGANIYGTGDNFKESGHVVASLIARFHDAKVSEKKSVVIWGTGKPRREFLYNEDFADACIFLMNNYNENDVVNIGSGEDIAIMDLAEMIKKIVGFKGEIVKDLSRPDGTMKKVLDVSKINSLGWRHKISLEQGIEETYKWFLKNYDRIKK